ncbi:streptogrisin-C [Sarocladium strictum]
MELTVLLSLLAATLPLAYGVPTETSNRLQPEVLMAMERDLGLSAQQAEARVAREAKSVHVIEKLRSTLGDAFAGAWLTEDGQTINVAVTDEASAELVNKAGAVPTVQANSISKLEKAMELLNKMEQPQARRDGSSESHSGVATWYIDVVSNKVVLEALANSVADAKKMAHEAGLAESEFDVQVVKEIPVTAATIVGGDAFFINGNTRCSIGFSVNNGFVTAGHCGGAGASTTNSNGEYLGNFGGSIFPSRDMAWVPTVGGTVLSPYIQGYGSFTPGVKGSNVAPVGASICRSGSTSGLRCGSVTAQGVTINYSEGAVYGATGTNACCQPGDSGGSFFAGDQAQGVTSGGSDFCGSGSNPQTYFQPINDILSQYGVWLITEA